MDVQEELGNPFVLPDLWGKSSFAILDHETSDFALEDLDSRLWQLELSLGAKDNAETPLLDINLELPTLHDLETKSLDTVWHEPLEDLGSLECPTPSLSEASTDQVIFQIDDVWSAPNFLSLDKPPPKARTWESFYNDGFETSRTCYVSEAGPEVLDAILSRQASGQVENVSEHSSGHILKSGPLLAGLLQLVMGRDSVIFRYVGTEEGFQSRFGNVRMSGYCPETFASLTDSITTFANRLKSLNSFVDEVCSRGRTCRSMIALANHVSKLLLTLQAQLYQASQGTHSMLQLQALIREPDLLLARLSSLIKQITTTEGDEELLFTLFGFAQDSDHSTWLRPTVLGMLSHATRPWLSSLGKWIGVQVDHEGHYHQSSPGFVHATTTVAKDDQGKESTTYEFEFDGSRLPGFVASEEAERMFEVGLDLRLLQTHIPEHPILHAKSAVQKPPELELHFSWQDIGRIEAQAKAYEEALLFAIKEFDTGKNMTGRELGIGAEDLLASADRTLAPLEAPERYIAASIAQIEEPLYDLQTDFQAKITETEDVNSFSPPFSVIPSLSFTPIISAQARLINQSTLHLLFKGHKLRSHLALQHRYQLLGGGVFASRLSHALFDADIPSAERRKGNPRLGTSGLKLGARESWPPASSELRLALMGILSDDYCGTDSSTTHRSNDLPGGLSFAIRAMSEDELGRCMDPNSIWALDFLRLQYKPPPPLDVIISSTSLEKYDIVFKLLVRANRMLYAVTHFTRAPLVVDMIAQRFKFEAHHFVSCVCSYLFENVTSIWKVFEKRLDALELRIEHYEIGEHDRLKRLREMHDGMLDDMMFALLLRKRQEMVMGLLEEIFSIVLVFAHRERSGDGFDARSDYERFRKKVKVFVSVCRGLSERKAFSGVGGTAAGDEGGGIAGLLLRLEMSGYYTRAGK